MKRARSRLPAAASLGSGRFAGWLVVAIAAALPTACLELPSIPANACGNRVVDDGEDCDGAAEGGQDCYAPGTANACRFSCAGEAGVCPAGYGCGADAVCRAPSGLFVPAGSFPSGRAARSIRFADFDGDRWPDLLELGQLYGADGMSVHFFDARGVLAQTFQQPSASGSAEAIGRLTADARADAALATPAGVTVFRGLASRTLAPTPYSSLPTFAGDGAIRLVAADVLPDSLTSPPRNLGAEILGFAGNTLIRESGGEAEILRTLPFSLAELAGDIVVADLLEDPVASPCPELVLAGKGRSRVEIITPCRLQGATLVWANEATSALAPVLLPAGRQVGSGVLSADLNGDGHLDLLIDASGSEPYELLAAYGLGDGTFHSAPPEEGVPADGVAGPLEPYDSAGLLGMPLAAGDLDGNGFADFVSPGAIHLRDASGEYAAHWLPTGASEAVIADLNDNGKADIVIARYDGGLDFYNNAGGGLFNVKPISTVAFASRLAVGDFDGDLIQDLAFTREQASGVAEPPQGTPIPGPGGGPIAEGAASSAARVLAVAFGRPFGPPETPVELGELGAVDHVLVGRVLEPDSTDTLRGMDDLAAVSYSDVSHRSTVAIFHGNTHRNLQSPFALFGQDGAPQTPCLVAVADFDGDAHDDVAVVAAEGEFGCVSDSRRWLWLLRSTGEASLEIPPGSGPLDLGEELSKFLWWQSILTAPATIAGAAPELPRIHVFGSVAEVKHESGYENWYEHAAYFSARWTGKSWEPSALRTLDMPPLVGLVRGDVDGDGLTDIVALSSGYSDLSEPPSSRILVFLGADDASPLADPLVFELNIGLNDVSVGGYDRVGTGEIGIGYGYVLPSLALLPLDQTPGLELLVGTESSIQPFTFDFAEKALKPFYGGAGLRGGEAPSPGLVEPSDPVTSSSGAQLLDSLGGAHALAVGDVDRDGVLDLAVLVGQQINILRSVPRVP